MRKSVKKAKVPNTKNVRKGKVKPMQSGRKGGGLHPRVGATNDHMKMHGSLKRHGM